MSKCERIRVFEDELYKVFSNGKIYSKTKHRFLKPSLNKYGYLYHSHFHNKCMTVHQIIARIFIGEPPKNMVDPTIDHIDHNRLNNDVSNLRWLERSENAKATLIKQIGEKNPAAILTEKDVIQICELLENGCELLPIAKRFNVDKTTISNIKRKKNWVAISSKYKFSTKPAKTKEQCIKQREEIKRLILEGKKT